MSAHPEIVVVSDFGIAEFSDLQAARTLLADLANPATLDAAG